MNLGIRQRIAIRFNQLKFRSRTSSPFLSGDAFKELSDFSVSKRADLTNLNTKFLEGTLIFCQSDLVEELISVIDGRSSGAYLIAGNSDRDFNQEPLGLTKLFQKSFLQNSNISNNSNIFTLPIGIENLRLGINGLPENLRSTIPWGERKDGVLVGPFSPTHEARSNFFSSFQFQDSLFTNLTSFISPRKYSEIVKRHKYVLCPRGNGLDTHRFWEALYRGAIPIVERSNWSQSLKMHDIPFVEVESFDSIQILERLREIDKLEKFANYDSKQVKSLWIDYWVSLFRK